jgi:hypothetical protein
LDYNAYAIQVGVALSFLIPPAVVKNHEELQDIENDLRMLCYGLAVGPTAALILLLLCKRSNHVF